jgi:hypothetical protein
MNSTQRRVKETLALFAIIVMLLMIVAIPYMAGRLFPASTAPLEIVEGRSATVYSAALQEQDVFVLEKSSTFRVEYYRLFVETEDGGLQSKELAVVKTVLFLDVKEGGTSYVVEKVTPNGKVVAWELHLPLNTMIQSCVST